MLELQEELGNTYAELLDYMDAIAFLHLGVSLMYRMSDDKTLNFKQAVKDNRKFLNENFPRWKKTKYTKLSYVLTHNGANFKLWVVKMFINLGLFRLFIACYKFMIKRIGIDIKW